MMAHARSATVTWEDLSPAAANSRGSQHGPACERSWTTEENRAPGRDGNGRSRSSSSRHADAWLDTEIARVRGLGIHELRVTWRKVFRQTLVPPLTRDLLARMITWRLQEQAFGGLDRDTAKLLDRLADGKPPEPPRRLRPGTVLVREHEGERHTVTVVPDGFVWRDEVYPSLSTIARAITGTAWSGPRFFGIARSGGARP